MSDRLEIRSVADQVYVPLREWIVSGELAPGTRIRQEAIAERLSVSRTPLREALVRLAAEGLVELAPNRGATVARHDFADLRQAWEARLVVEPPAARLAAERRDAAGLGRMRDAIDGQRRFAGDPTRSFALNRDFHVALVAAAGNDYLRRLSEILWRSRIGIPIFARQAVEIGDELGWADDHERIADAVEAADGEEAERLTRTHIENAPPPAAAR